MSETELEDVLKKLNDYEPGIIDIIKDYTKTYTFETNDELRDAVKLWRFNKDKGIKKYGHISHWDTSKITDMSHLFKNMKYFNEDISRWDTGNVTYMKGMFGGAYSFNEDLSTWDTSNVENMSCMFFQAFSFNQDISSWDTSKITDTRYMMLMFFKCRIGKEYKPDVN